MPVFTVWVVSRVHQKPTPQSKTRNFRHARQCWYHQGSGRDKAFVWQYPLDSGQYCAVMLPVWWFHEMLVCLEPLYYIQRIKESVVFLCLKNLWDTQKINSAFHVSLSTCNYISSVHKKKFLISLFWHIFTFKICQWGFILWQNEMYSLLILNIYC